MYSWMNFASKLGFDQLYDFITCGYHFKVKPKINPMLMNVVDHKKNHNWVRSHYIGSI